MWIFVEVLQKDFFCLETFSIKDKEREISTQQKSSETCCFVKYNFELMNRTTKVKKRGLCWSITFKNSLNEWIWLKNKKKITLRVVEGVKLVDWNGGVHLLNDLFQIFHSFNWKRKYSLNIYKIQVLPRQREAFSKIKRIFLKCFCFCISATKNRGGKGIF